MDRALLERLNVTRAARRAAVLATDTGNGESRLVIEGEDLADDPIGEEIAQRLRSGASGMARTEGAQGVFLTVHLPPPRLVVVGAVHISQALAPMARLAGFDMTIIDPRTAFASPDRFPDVHIITAWPAAALAEVTLDRHTAVAALTHDPKIDDDALVAALRAGCFYVGALGSRKTHARRRDRLSSLGVDEAGLDRIHAPIGIGIGAQSPAEIAVAILAQIIDALRRRGLPEDHPE